jgi:hypothetical protein
LGDLEAEGFIETIARKDLTAARIKPEMAPELPEFQAPIEGAPASAPLQAA